MHMSENAMNDREMVKMALKDATLFGNVIERYEAPLQRYIRRLGVKTIEDQQDVLQEIFIKVYRNLNAFDSSLKFSSWIYRIAHNEAISWFRKYNVRPEGHLIADSEDLLILQQTKLHNQEVLFDEDINADVIRDALSVLDAKYREVLILRFFEHKEYDEISDILKIPVGTVGTLIHRGKQKLKSIINPDHVRI